MCFCQIKVYLQIKILAKFLIPKKVLDKVGPSPANCM